MNALNAFVKFLFHKEFSSLCTLFYGTKGGVFGAARRGATTRFLYDGADIIAEYDGSGTLLRRYIHGPGIDEPPIWLEGTGTSDRRFLHADQRGSVIGVTNAAGVMDQNLYSAYGTPAAGNTGRFQYTGQIWLAEGGIDLYHYKARAYSPALGRFLQPDPMKYEGGMNLYAYAGGDPVNFNDAMGRKPDYIQDRFNAALLDSALNHPRELLLVSGVVAGTGAAVYGCVLGGCQAAFVVISACTGTCIPTAIGGTAGFGVEGFSQYQNGSFDGWGLFSSTVIGAAGGYGSTFGKTIFLQMGGAFAGGFSANSMFDSIDIGLQYRSGQEITLGHFTDLGLTSLQTGFNSALGAGAGGVFSGVLTRIPVFGGVGSLTDGGIAAGAVSVVR